MGSTSQVARGREERPYSLGRDADFLKLWSALSVSLVGTGVTLLALPLIAVVTLDASPFQVGLLAAAGQAPYVLVSLPAGVWADRVRRKPLLVWTDVGSAALLVTVPIAAAVGGLSLVQFCLVAFGVGALAVVGEVAHYAYAPTVMGRAHLVEGNSRFQASHSAAELAGPGVGGLLIQALTAPVAILVDAASFVVSALLVGAIRRPERTPVAPEVSAPVGKEIAAGLRALLGHPLLRPIVLVSAATNLFGEAGVAIYILYASRELGLSPATIGLVFALSGVFAVLGATMAPRAANKVGVGPAIIGGWTLSAGAGLLVPLADGPTWAIVAVLIAARGAAGLTGTIANIHQWSLRQAVTPNQFQGKVTASHRFVVYGAGAFGAVIGGGLGEVVGLRTALVACAAGATIAALAAAWTPLRRLRVQPAAAD